MTGIFIEGSTINIGVTGSGGSGWSPIGAAFDADYTRNRYSDSGMSASFNDLHTLTRLSAKTAFDSAGNLVSFASGVPAITDRGLLIEEARTNGNRNPRFVGAVPGTPGTNPTFCTFTTTPAGLTKTVVAVGNENGLDYQDTRWSGVANTAAATILADFETTNQIAASVGQTWTGSLFHKLVGGDLTNVVSLGTEISERDAGGGSLVFGAVNFTPTATRARTENTRTLANASTAFVLQRLRGVFTNGGAVDFTLRTYLPQTELGAFATSPILPLPGQTGASTRAADVITAPSRFASLAKGSALIEWEETLGPISQERRLFSMRVDGNNRLLAAVNPSNKANFSIVNGGAGVADLASTNNVAAGNTYKLAARWADNDAAASMTAALQATVLADTSCAMLTGAFDLGVGQSATGGSFLNGYLRRLTFFPRKQTDAELPALVA